MTPGHKQKSRIPDGSYGYITTNHQVHPLVTRRVVAFFFFRFEKGCSSPKNPTQFVIQPNEFDPRMEVQMH